MQIIQLALLAQPLWMVNQKLLKIIVQRVVLHAQQQELYIQYVLNQIQTHGIKKMLRYYQFMV